MPIRSRALAGGSSAQVKDGSAAAMSTAARAHVVSWSFIGGLDLWMLVKVVLLAKSQGFSAKVSGGEATLTGNANNAGSKGAATGIAKRCGATKVTNNITSPAVSKPKKSGDAKPAEKKG